MLVGAAAVISPARSLSSLNPPAAFCKESGKLLQKRSPCETRGFDFQLENVRSLLDVAVISTRQVLVLFKSSSRVLHEPQEQTQRPSMCFESEKEGNLFSYQG
jgi:hypothetical protein